MISISLAAARVNAELLQEDAAKKIGVTAKTLSNYEKGRTTIPASIFKKAASVYGLPDECIRVPMVDDGEYDDTDFFTT